MVRGDVHHSSPPPHFPHEDPDKPEPTGDDGHEQIAHELPEPVALPRIDVKAVGIHVIIAPKFTHLEPVLLHAGDRADPSGSAE